MKAKTTHDLLDYMNELINSQNKKHLSSIADALIADALDLAPLHESANEPTDDEIVEVYMDAFGGTAENAIERLRRFAATLAG